LILASFQAEWFKIVRRSACWVTIALLVAFAAVIGYVITYLVATHPPQVQGTPDFASVRADLYPEALVKKALDNASTLDGVFALILGVLVQGSEFSWRTLKTAQTQLPGRLAITSGRLVAITLLLLLTTLILFAADGTAAYVVALVDGRSTAFPSAVDIFKGIGAEWLIFEFMAILGFGLATVFRQAPMAIGLGLAYALVMENLVFGLLSPLGGLVERIQSLLPVANAEYLQQSFGQVSSVVGIDFVSAGTVDVTRATLVLAAWVAGLVAMSAGLAQVRDID
jgi:hypothetical protein